MIAPMLLLIGCLPSVIPDSIPTPVLEVDTASDTSPWGDTGEAPVPTVALVATSSEDFSIGALAMVSIETLEVTDAIVPLAADVVVQTDDGISFIISRHNTDTVRVYESLNFNQPSLDFSVGDLANPQDALICGERLFVTLHNRAEIPAYDPTTGQRVGSVDLSEFAGEDGAAEASDLVEVGGRLYVAVQQLDQDRGWTSERGSIVEIDCESASITGRTETGPSPSLFAWPGHPDVLWVRTGLYGSEDGALSRLDIGSGVLEVVLEESTLSEDLTDGAASVDTVFVVSTNADWQYTIGCVDTETGAYTAGPSYPNYLSDIQVDPYGRAWVTARPGWASETPVPGGIRLFDGETCSPLLADDGRITTTLPPFDLAFL